MKTKILSIAILIAGMTLFTTSCEKNEPKMDKDKTKEIKNHDVFNDKANWSYFSFEKGEFVGKGSANPNDKDDAKWKARTDWDIAFHFFHIRTNGGTSGDGKGELLVLNTEDFDTIKEVPTNANFIKDEIVDKTKSNFFIEMKSGAERYDVSINKAGSFFWIFDHKTRTPKLNKKVQILKTASGKYVKFQFTNIVSDKGEVGKLSFKYVYQPDGSMKFDK